MDSIKKSEDGSQRLIPESATRIPSRRDRKRATDRESQRLSRARAKAYVAQLEKTVGELTQTSSTEPTAGVTKQLKEQFEEIERLKGIILGIGKLTQGLAQPDQSAISQGSQGFEGLLTGSSSDRSGSITELPDDFDDHEVHTVSQSVGSGSNQKAVGLIRIPQTIGPKTAVSTMRAENSLLTQRSEWMYTFLFCGEGNRNYFEAIDTVISKILLSDNRRPYLGPEDDDDLALRAVLHGWQNARKMYEFDLVWQFLEALDQGLWYRAGNVERVAVLRVMRALLLRKIGPPGQQSRPIPGYLMPTEMQNMIGHPVIVDYFVWPALRDHLILTNTWYTAETDSATYAQSFRFMWRYDSRDVYKQDAVTGRYSFSMEFDRSFNDLGSWVNYYEGPTIYPPQESPMLQAHYDSTLSNAGTSSAGAAGSGSFLDEQPEVKPSIEFEEESTSAVHYIHEGSGSHPFQTINNL